MFDVLSPEFGMKNKRRRVRSRMFIFADYSVTEEYEDFMDRILNDTRYELLEVQENFDMQGTLTKVVLYTVLEDNNGNTEQNQQ